MQDYIYYRHRLNPFWVFNAIIQNCCIYEFKWVSPGSDIPLARFPPLICLAMHYLSRIYCPTLLLSTLVTVLCCAMLCYAAWLYYSHTAFSTVLYCTVVGTIVQFGYILQLRGSYGVLLLLFSSTSVLVPKTLEVNVFSCKIILIVLKKYFLYICML